MRCPHCGARIQGENLICPRCGKSLTPAGRFDTSSAHKKAHTGESQKSGLQVLEKALKWVREPQKRLSKRAYRDRRKRYRFLRGLRSAGILLGLAALILLLALGVRGLFGHPAPDNPKGPIVAVPTPMTTRPPDGGPTAEPTPAATIVPAPPTWQTVDTLPLPDYIVNATAAPAPAPQATTDLIAETLAPTATPVVTASPQPTVSAEDTPRPETTPQPEVTPAPVGPSITLAPMDLFPTAAPQRDEQQPTRINSREALIDLYWYMIRTGTQVVELDSLTVSRDVIAETADKFSNYFTAFGYNTNPARVAVSFKAGLVALYAIRNYTFYDLEDEYQRVAIGAMAALAPMLQPDMTDLDKEIAIHDYILERCEYRDDESLYTGDARGFFLNGVCQCSGYADTFRLMATLAGLETEMIGGPTTRDEPGSKGHAWNLVRLDGLWYVVDPTWDDMIAGTGEVEHTFFNLPQSAFGSTRSWDAGCLPEGEYAQKVDDHYYYHRAEYMARDQEQAVSLAKKQAAESKKAYIYSENGDFSRPVVYALKEIYNGCGHRELSEDLNFDLYSFAVK